ncbi:MAG TPA: acyltransferase [Acidobacteriaceae bacterium]|nr:acyltransferase [Acidobacteriaceae bacterium]
MSLHGCGGICDGEISRRITQQQKPGTGRVFEEEWDRSASRSGAEEKFAAARREAPIGCRYGNLSISRPRFDHEPPLNSSPAPSRISALTGVRFFAAIAVVLYHYWEDLMPGIPTRRIFESGFMGVSFFYVLSGYILAYVYLRTDTPKTDWKKFYVARFARVYPSYALSLVVQFPLIGWLLLHYRSPIKYTLIALGTLGVHILLLQAWWPVLDWRWNPPSWSISAEAFFYLLFPVLGIWSLRLRNPIRLAILIGLSYLLMLAPAAGLLLHGVGWSDQPRPESFLFVVFAPIFRIPEFMMGVFLSILHRRIASAWAPARVARIGQIATYSGLVASAVVIFNGRRIPFVIRYNGITDLAFAAIIFGLAAAPTLLRRVLSHPFLVLLGEASYSVYILQAPIVDYFRPMVTRFHGPTLFAAYLVTLIAASILSFLYVESPLREGIKRWYARLASRNSMPKNSVVT